MLSQRTPNRQKHKQDIPSRISDTEATRLNAANSRGTNNEDFSRLSKMKDLASVALRYTLRNQSNGFDLRILEDVKGARVHRPRTSEINNDIDIGMLAYGLLNARVHWEESLLRTPVELLDMVPTEGIDHSRYGRS